jgi:hypothetical protein
VRQAVDPDRKRAGSTLDRAYANAQSKRIAPIARCIPWQRVSARSRIYPLAGKRQLEGVDLMNKLIAALVAAAFVVAPVFAQDKKADAKPTMEQCKKDPKMKGCDEVLKKEKKAKGGC